VFYVVILSKNRQFRLFSGVRALKGKKATPKGGLWRYFPMMFFH